MGSISVALHDEEIQDLDNFIRHTNGSTLAIEVESYLQEWISLKGMETKKVESLEIQEEDNTIPIPPSTHISNRVKYVEKNGIVSGKQYWKFIHTDETQTPKHCTFGGHDYDLVCKFALEMKKCGYDHSKGEEIRSKIRYPPSSLNYVYLNKGKYKIQKTINQITYSYGNWSTKNMAEYVVSYLEYKQWDSNLSSRISKYSRNKYREWLLDTIKNDVEYQEYLKNKDGD